MFCFASFLESFSENIHFHNNQVHQLLPDVPERSRKSENEHRPFKLRGLEHCFCCSLYSAPMFLRPRTTPTPMM
uniref:Photosystem I reaction center subunit psaK n=1 Tax=Rhizophora mucronata TaxID=61149 RepID=A0A2P2KRI4_RHIMU